jgi:glutathione synthase/RimK-type ligase-like ATP-grasp enzyme
MRRPRTNIPDEARRVIEGCADGVAFKGISGTKTWASGYEPALNERRLPLIANYPVLFQERIDDPDIRVHTIGDAAVAESIESPEVAYRRAKGNRYRSVELPPRIAEGCANLTREFGIPFIGLDFKVKRSTGEWYILEANTMPCF